MDYTAEELLEAKRQLSSALHKTEKVAETFQSKENAGHYKSQITLALRRVEAFKLALALIEEKLALPEDRGG